MDSKYTNQPISREPEYVSDAALKAMTVDWLQKYLATYRYLRKEAIEAKDTAAIETARAFCNRLQNELNRRARIVMARSMYDTIKFIILLNVRSVGDYYMTPASHLSKDLDIPKPTVLAILRDLVDEGMVELRSCYSEDDGMLNGSGYQRTMAGDTHVSEVTA